MAHRTTNFGKTVGHSAQTNVQVQQHRIMRINNLIFPVGAQTPRVTDLHNKFHVFCRIESQNRIPGALHGQKTTSSPRIGSLPRYGASNFSGFHINPQQQNRYDYLGTNYTSDWPNRDDVPHRTQRRPYNWRSWDGVGTKSRSDARDAVYLYTYKMKNDVSEEDVSESLPQIYQLKPRPHTVAESNPSADTSGRGTGKFKHLNSANHEWRNQNILHMARRNYLRNRDDRKQIHGDEDIDIAFSLDVQRFRTSQQRRTLSGKDGRLFSKVHQSFDRVKTSNRKVLAPKIQRPMQKEQGHYRPISRTIVKTPNRKDTPSPDDKDHRSAEAYNLFVQAHEEELLRESSPRKTPSSRFRLTTNTAASEYHDTENRLLQSVIEVNKPTSELTTPPNLTPQSIPMTTSRLSARNNSVISDYPNRETRLLQSVIDVNKPLSRITTPECVSPQTIHIPDTTYADSCATPVTTNET